MTPTFHCAGSVDFLSPKVSPWNFLSNDVYITAQWKVLGVENVNFMIFYLIHNDSLFKLSTVQLVSFFHQKKIPREISVRLMYISVHSGKF